MNADGLCPDSELYCGMIQSLARNHDPIIACSLFQAWLGQKITPSLEVVNELVESFEKSNMPFVAMQVYIRKIANAYREWGANRAKGSQTEPKGGQKGDIRNIANAYREWLGENESP